MVKDCDGPNLGLLWSAHGKKSNDFWYYQVPTFWQSNTFWFVSLDAEGFRARSSSLNYLIHESWFLFDENRISFVVGVEKGTTFWQNVTQCHARQHVKFNLWQVIGWQQAVATNKQTAWLLGGAWIVATSSRPEAAWRWWCSKHAKQKQSLWKFVIETLDALRCGLNFFREFAP